MNKEKQIEEMAVIVSNSIREWANDLPPISCPVYNAEALYNAGYRKQKEVERLKAEVAREIFEELEELKWMPFESEHYVVGYDDIAELKKKYMGKENENNEM